MSYLSSRRYIRAPTQDSNSVASTFTFQIEQNKGAELETRSRPACLAAARNGKEDSFNFHNPAAIDSRAIKRKTVPNLLLTMVMATVFARLTCTPIQIKVNFGSQPHRFFFLYNRYGHRFFFSCTGHFLLVWRSALHASICFL